MLGKNKQNNLLPGQVDLWWIRLSDWQQAGLSVCLDDSERDRAARFKFDKDRFNFIAAHAAMRYVLSSYLGCLPTVIRYEITEQGKPYLADRALSFNLTHAGEFALVAVAASGQLGVDIEKVDPQRNIINVAKRFFTPSEVAFIEQATDPTQAAFASWVCKEAVVKATGQGIALSFDQFSVDLAARPKIVSKSTINNDLQSLSLSLLSAPEGYKAAIVCEFDQFKLNTYCSDSTLKLLCK